MSAVPIGRSEFQQGAGRDKFRAVSGAIIDPARVACHIETMTIDLAEWLLQRNRRNRILKVRALARYTDQFQRGRWELTSQGIGITKTGLLADGQHRLIAWIELAKSGCFTMWQALIVTGLSEEAQQKVDNGVSRSIADSLKMFFDGNINNTLVAVVRILLGGIRVGIKKDGTEAFISAPDHSSKMDAQDVIDFLREHHETIEPIITAFGKMPAPLVAAVCEYGLRGYLKEAIEFATQIRNGENLTSSDPAYKVINSLLPRGAGKKSPKLRGDLDRVDLYARTVSACCAHGRGQPLSKLYAASGWSGLPRRNGQ